jgi:hypothetical protein
MSSPKALFSAKSPATELVKNRIPQETFDDAHNDLYLCAFSPTTIKLRG